MRGCGLALGIGSKEGGGGGGRRFVAYWLDVRGLPWSDVVDELVCILPSNVK